VSLPGQLHTGTSGWVGGSEPKPPKTWNIITFDDEKEMLRYVILTGRKPVDAERIDHKKDHFNFSHWKSSSLQLDDGIVALLKDL
jgi:hypothetical protein